MTANITQNGNGYQLGGTGQFYGSEAEARAAYANPQAPVAPTGPPNANGTPANTLQAGDLGYKAPTPPVDNPNATVGTSSAYGSYVGDLGTNIKSLTDASTANSNLITNRLATLTADYGSQVNGINSSYGTQGTDLANKQAKETGAESAGLTRIGGYLGGSASGMSAIRGLETTHHQEVLNLENSKQNALQQAKSAYDTGNYELAQKLVDNANKLQDDIYKRQTDFYNASRQQTIDDQTAAKNNQDLATVLAPTIAASWTADPVANQALIDHLVTSHPGLDPDVLRSAVMQYNQGVQKDSRLTVGDKVYERQADGSYKMVLDGTTTLSEADKQKSATQKAIADGTSVQEAYNALYGGGGAVDSSTGQVRADGTVGGQCGDYLHAIMSNTPTFGDTWQTKAAAMNITPDQFAANPQVGDIVAFKVKLPTGHVAVVTAIDGNKMTINESNYASKETVGSRTVDINDPSILGAYRGATFKNGNTVASQGGFAATPEAQTFLEDKTPQQQAVFNKLPATDQSTVMQLINGDILLNDSSLGSGKQGALAKQKFIGIAQQIDPTFSATQNEQRYKFKTEWNNPNSKTYLTLTAGNTALGHLAELKGASTALNTKDLQKYNSISQYLTKNAGKPEVYAFNTALTQVASELAQFYTGGVPTESEISAQKANLLSTLSPKQLSASINTLADLVGSKTAALGTGYKNIMGEYPSSPILDPDTIARLKAAGVDTSKIQAALAKQTPTPPSGQISYLHPTSNSSSFDWSSLSGMPGLNGN